MKAERKERILTKLKDRQLYPFFLLPCCLFIAAVVWAIVGLGGNDKPINFTAYAGVLSLFLAAAVLASVGRLFSLSKEKYKRNKILRIISVILILIFCAVEFFLLLTYMPKIADEAKRAEALYKQYEAAHEAGDEQQEKQFFDEWKQVSRANDDLRFRFNEYHLINFVVCFFSSLIISFFKKSYTDGKDEQPTDADKDKNGGDGGKDVTENIKL